jgi:hypothetical protein
VEQDNQQDHLPMVGGETQVVDSVRTQEVGRRKGTKELVVIWAYSVVLSGLFDL